MKNLLAISLLLLFILGCGEAYKQEQKTQLEIRQMQTRTYEIESMKAIVKAILNVLQDDSFIVKQVNIDLGFLNATKEVDVESKNERFWQRFWWGKRGATYKKNTVIDCTANISEFGEEKRVRVNFQAKVIDNRGGVVSVRQIDSLEFYQEFFAKVDKGIFIEKEGI